MQSLVTEADLTLEKLITIAQTWQSADQHIKQIEWDISGSNLDDTINRLGRGNRYPTVVKDNCNKVSQIHIVYGHQKSAPIAKKYKTCGKCRYAGHTSEECRCGRGKGCVNCGKQGHFKDVLNKKNNLHKLKFTYSSSINAATGTNHQQTN